MEEALRHGKTLLQWLTMMFHDGSSPACTPYLVEVLPALFSLPELKDDKELLGLCGTVLEFSCQVKPKKKKREKKKNRKKE